MENWQGCFIRLSTIFIWSVCTIEIQINTKYSRSVKIYHRAMLTYVCRARIIGTGCLIPDRHQSKNFVFIEEYPAYGPSLSNDSTILKFKQEKKTKNTNSIVLKRFRIVMSPVCKPASLVCTNQKEFEFDYFRMYKLELGSNTLYRARTSSLSHHFPCISLTASTFRCKSDRDQNQEKMKCICVITVYTCAEHLHWIKRMIVITLSIYRGSSYNAAAAVATAAVWFRAFTVRSICVPCYRKLMWK